MTDKIIFWFSADLLPYCLSHFFQKKFDGELFGIYDLTNKPKKFFKKQNFIDFSKIWFYHDHISSKNKADLKYLEQINNKYELDLKELAKNDRILNKYNEYYNFSDNEINSILESECKLFENILDEVKPEYFITTETTLQPHHLFYKMCKKRGVKILMLNHANWKKLCYISEIRHKIDGLDQLNQIKDEQMSLKQIQKLFEESRVSKYHKKFHNEIKKSQITLVKAAIKFLISNNDNIKTHYTYFGRKKLKVLMKEFQDKIKKNTRKKFIDEKLIKKIKKDVKFIYLPLHQEPERSLLIAAPKFSNQLYTIKQISENLPKDHQLYVKEHPTQGPARNWRKLSFYKQIMELKNVKLFHPDFDSKVLLKNCSLVISVGGTSSFEATFFGKPSLIFADLGYKIIPSIKKLNSYSELKQGIADSLKIKVDPNDVINYIKKLEDNSFEFDVLNFETKYQNAFYMNGNLVDVNFDHKIMNEFLLGNSQELKNLADEFIRKIYQFKAGTHNKNTE